LKGTSGWDGRAAVAFPPILYPKIICAIAKRRAAFYRHRIASRGAGSKSSATWRLVITTLIRVSRNIRIYNWHIFKVLIDIQPVRPTARF
jgi:hypothetical protein